MNAHVLLNSFNEAEGKREKMLVLTSLLNRITQKTIMLDFIYLSYDTKIDNFRAPLYVLGIMKWLGNSGTMSRGQLLVFFNRNSTTMNLLLKRSK